MGMRYKVNAPNVVHESLDDEVVLIHLEKGSFYNFGKTGIDIWKGLMSGLTAEQLVTSLGDRYEAESDTIATEVNRFIEKLSQEELIVADENAEAAIPEAAGVDEKSPFELPVLEKFTDMQDLLLLDPIHQVSESGWPNVPNADGAKDAA